MRVLTWNLFHGRADPPAGYLFDEFAAAIAGWDWDVALLQEVPPWWPAPLAHAAHASMRMSLTSRNWLGGLRRPLAIALPDVLKSEGGGCNAILVRGQAIVRHEQVELTRKPERRTAHAVELADGAWVCNLHASKQEPRAQTDADVALATRSLVKWSGGAPRGAVLGGDLNVRDPDVPGFTHLSWHWVDHVYARGFVRSGRGEVLDPRPLSDHRPILVELAAEG